MKIVVVLTVSSLLTAISAQAQDFRGPIARSLAQEATRLASAQTRASVEASGWATVKTLSPGETIHIGLTNAPELVGRFEFADDTDVVIRDKRASHRISRADVLRITAEGKGSQTGGLIGAASGALLGFFIASRFDWSECNCGMGSATLVVLPLGLGTGLGLTGYFGFRKSPRVIYRWNGS